MAARRVVTLAYTTPHSTGTTRADGRKRW